MKQLNVGIIGLGKLGKPVFEFFSEEFHRLDNYKNSKFYGFDIVKENRESDHYIFCNSIEELFRKNLNIIFIAVPTPHNLDYDGSKPTSSLTPKNFDISIVKNVLNEITKYKKENQTIVLISTVLPGTTRESFGEIIPDLIYNPYFIAMGTVKEDMRNPEMIVIGINNKTNSENTEKLNRLLYFYDILYNKEKRIVVGTWEEAEAIKVFYNTFISTKISFVNMILDFSKKIKNLDPNFVCQELSKSTYRLISDMYMKPGMGDGGPCHPRDNIALSYLSQKYDMSYDFFGFIMKIREEQAKNAAKLLISTLIENNYDKIIINGKSYKDNVNLIDGSYSILIGNYCKELGYEPFYIDNNTQIKLDPKLKYVVLLSHKKLYYEFSRNTIIIDPWEGYKIEKL